MGPLAKSVGQTTNVALASVPPSLERKSTLNFFCRRNGDTSLTSALIRGDGSPCDVGGDGGGYVRCPGMG